MTNHRAYHERRASWGIRDRRSPWFVVVLVFGGCLGALCDSFYGVSGRVVSCDARAPLPDASVRLEVPAIDRRGSSVTRPDGRFHVAVNYPEGSEPSELIVSKPGYRESKRSVEDPKVEQDVCLEPIDRTAR